MDDLRLHLLYLDWPKACKGCKKPCASYYALVEGHGSDLRVLGIARVCGRRCARAVLSEA